MSFTETLSQHYADVRARLGLGPARPFHFRPPQPKPVAIERVPKAPTPTLNERIVLAAREAAARIEKGDFIGRRTPVIIAVCEEAFMLRPGAIASASRRGHLIAPRHVGMTLAWLFTTYSWATIGRDFNRDHTTVIHGRDKFLPLARDLLSAEPEGPVKRVMADVAEKRGLMP
ncbi:MAG TPA: helix-turn-helix domain-containing protein [Pseudolabrys sp.]|nr:helix-turn-helix domain-containing protein [Pseudolabrys sp.]